MGIVDEIFKRQCQAISDQVWDEIEDLVPGLRGTPRGGFWFYIDPRDLEDQ